MSQRCMPLLFLNMGGEMAYILEQRLKNVGEEKSVKVLNDILYTMLNRKFLEELFKPQEIHSRRTMRQFFEKLAHSSIMRLNETSMDKLYDLMTMTVKCPDQILPMTINHLDGIRNLLPDDQKLAALLDNVYNMIMVNFRETQLWEWTLIRACLLSFFQDARVKVSLLLREKRQLENGAFVFFPGDEVHLSPAYQAPGQIRYFENGENTKTVNFPTKRTYIHISQPENLSQMATDRVCKLGVNIYKSTDSVQVKGGGGTGKQEADRPMGELKLLTELLAGSDASAGGEGFDLSLFADENEEATFQKETEKLLANIKRIDASKDKKTLNKAIEEMRIDDGGVKKKKAKGEDMLEMLDEAAARPATAKKRTGSAKRTPSRDGAEQRESRATSAKGARTREDSAKTRDRTGSARRKPSAGPR